MPSHRIYDTRPTSHCCYCYCYCYCCYCRDGDAGDGCCCCCHCDGGGGLLLLLVAAVAGDDCCCYCRLPRKARTIAASGDARSTGTALPLAAPERLECLARRDRK